MPNNWPCLIIPMQQDMHSVYSFYIVCQRVELEYIMRRWGMYKWSSIHHHKLTSNIDRTIRLWNMQFPVCKKSNLKRTKVWNHGEILEQPPPDTVPLTCSLQDQHTLNKHFSYFPASPSPPFEILWWTSGSTVVYAQNYM